MTAPEAPDPVATAHLEARLALGALVLGALAPVDRAAVEAHVASCAECTRELAGFAVLPGLLGRLSLDEALALDQLPTPLAGSDVPPDELLERILTRAHDHRTRRAHHRRTIASWSAAAVAVAAGVAWLLVTGPLAGADREPSAVVVATDDVVVQARDDASDVWGEVTLSPTANGTRVALDLTGVSPGEDCELVAWTADGRREVASTWRATYDGKATVTGSTSLPLAELAGLTVKTPDGRRLLNLPVPE
ncbi:anti-sigma factor [Pengzhenrongella sicca]|uniref:Zf-HC2 domain-containing protein n=1 Tax=Pengzhenrongella sicca TaxID=2819238 RepID=A0A8A4ZG14_9MICO|nr:anti-sigma factor [Pengzhenrongella sicca]QTE29466.1 zf-HC2 domain-containing protein [Pengzhenrongella sicca]